MRILPIQNMHLFKGVNSYKQRNSLNFKGNIVGFDYFQHANTDILKFNSKTEEPANNPKAPDIPADVDSMSRKFTDYDYTKLTEPDKEDISDMVSYETKALADASINMALVFMNELDKKYGEDGYRFVSVGTSPAGVGKAMQHMGKDVVFLPMSFSHETTAKPWLEKSPMIPFYRRYMEEKGLTNEALRDEGKRAVICDFVVSGRGLDLATFMLTGPLGLDSNLCDIITMNSIIENSDSLSQDSKEYYLKELLKKEIIGDYTDVPHFSFIDKEWAKRNKDLTYSEFKRQFDDYKTPYSNGYNFSLMRDLEVMELLELEEEPKKILPKGRNDKHAYIS